MGCFRVEARKCRFSPAVFSILNGQRGLDFFVKVFPLFRGPGSVLRFLSRIAREDDIPVVEPPLKDITHYTKEEKYGFRRGFIYRLQMYRECLYSLFNWRKYAQKYNGTSKNTLQV